VLEGYGLTETSPVVAVNRPGRVRMGTVGELIPGVEVRIAEDGEVLCRGPCIMKGYYGMEEETGRAIRDGWFHTGDVGELEDRYLRITDRKKDLFKTTAGKYVAPQPIESSLGRSPLVAHAMVLGAGRKFPVALIVPDFDFLRQKFGGKSLAEVVKEPEAVGLFQKELERVNAGLADFERIKGFALLPAPFSVETGELTPTLKVKRRVVQEKYADRIEELYR
jgi:long-chain acyl-CoA synthetase